MWILGNSLLALSFDIIIEIQLYMDSGSNIHKWIWKKIEKTEEFMKICNEEV